MEERLPAAPILSAFPPGPRPQINRDQFFNTPADTTESLVEALKTHPKFRKSLADHFKMPEDRVIEFVQDALVPYILPADREVTNFGITPKGKIYGHKTRLKKGQRVWATRNGNPILKWECSNPLTFNLPANRLRPNMPKLSFAPNSRALEPELVVPGELEAGVEHTRVVMLAPDEPGISTRPSTLVSEVSGESEITNPGTPSTNWSGVVGRGSVLLPLAGFAGAIVRAVPNGGGGTNAVPEPGTMALLGVGGLLALPLLRRRSR